ncbi:MAG: DUF4065 domain-containing protein [Verrucomicrobiae bacterium]|nr:DUF4065 domain-containing protein [Verrucomicrobiae bacterium]
MFPIQFRFNEEKATQAAAYLLKKNGNQMKYLGLIKLMYLADRETLRGMERPITGDRYVSMKNGPVLSSVKNLITEEDADREYWGEFISAPENFTVKLIKDPGTDELCEFEEEILDQVFEQYGRMDRFTLADLTHEICGEWKMPEEDGPGSTPIPVEEILHEVGKTQEEIQRISEEVWESNMLKFVLPES